MRTFDLSLRSSRIYYFSFFRHPATTQFYTLSLHDALPICWMGIAANRRLWMRELSLLSGLQRDDEQRVWLPDRKSTRLNSSHSQISYAVFCLQKTIN